MTSVVTEKGTTMEVIIKCSDDNRGGVRIDGTPIEEIVRCAECKHWHKLHGCIKNDDVNLCTNADDFCSYGERKESE